MLDWLKKLLRVPQPSGPAVTLRNFALTDRLVSTDSVTLEAEAWKLEATGGRTFLLFQVPQPGVDQCMLTYRVQMKTSAVRDGVYLEMWCVFGGNEYFSKGLHHKAKGTNDWASYQTPFYLKQGQFPDLIKLNLVFEGPGTVWLKDIELLKTPLA
ncbi:MAG TPA: hypothetical protein VLE48_10350 [Terriglobales bacterium]|nr:hypothetical protein [Terriglobales bacterium]